MEYANAFINGYQAAQTYFLETFVTDKKLKEPLLDIVGAQTDLLRYVSTSMTNLNVYKDLYKTK